MRVLGARVALSALHAERLDFTICGRRIWFDAAEKNAHEYDLSGYLILPGLINGHDHLEFSLFPRRGHGPYPNASAWAADIYRPRDSPIRQQLAIPKPVRLLWGAVKNLISGVTTVAHHNPWHEAFEHFPVRVARRIGWAHSIDFSPDVKERYRRTPRRWPFVIHAAEGTDEKSRLEIAYLDAAGVLGRSTIVVHAAGATAAEMDILREKRASIIWCPSSNLFTLGRTLSPGVFRSGIPVMLGTDSPLTATGDLIDEMEVAKTHGSLTDAELYEMVTTRPARLLRLPRGVGAISDGGAADLIAVRDRGLSPCETLCRLTPELVIVNGGIRLVSEALAGRIGAPCDGMFPLEVRGRGRFLVDAPIPMLAAAAQNAAGASLCLAGKQVMQ